MSQSTTEKFTSRDFRDALSSFATGVTIVTTRDAQNAPVGMTASSFNSVSTEPPLILWSVTKTAKSAPAFKTAEHFAVHVLATDQTELSNKFAKSGADKFGDTSFSVDTNGVPILENTAARFDCKTWEVYEGGDHWIIVGEVLAIESAKKEGLVFGGGTYAVASPLTASKNAETHETGSSEIIDDLLFYHLSRAYHQMAHQFHDEVRSKGLTVAEWRVSACLYAQSTCRFTELAARTFLDPQSMEDILSSMEEQGLCTLSQTDGERSATGTLKGHERVTSLIELAKGYEKDIMNDIDDVSPQALKSTLKKITTSALNS